MTSALAKFLAAVSLSCAAGSAAATTPAPIPAIDIFTTAGVPGTGGYSTVMGPCYCDQTAYFSPVMVLDPGTYDFGKVRQYWVAANFTPDGGMDQPNLYLLFSPVEVTGAWPYDFPVETSYVYPSSDQCAQDDDACNAHFLGAFQDFDLLITVAPGQNAVQVGLIGHYAYTSPVPELLPSSLLMLGLALLAAIAGRSGRLAHIA
jgi:hypothetical protein